MKEARFTHAELARITGGEILRHGGDEVLRLVTDTRHHTAAAGDLFIALKGAARDGHAFLQDAWNRGIRNYLVSGRLPGPDSLPDSFVLRVDDTLCALQQIAAAHRRKFQYPVVGITGSNGKTVVKEWLNTLLADDFRIVRSPRSFNSRIGVPLSVWAMGGEHTLALFEAGISAPGEMAALASIIAPDIGVLTTIGTAHLEHFRSPEAIAEEKCRLFRECRYVVYPTDNPAAVHGVQSLPKPAERIGWGTRADAWLRILRRETTGQVTLLELEHDNQSFRISVPFADAASVENAVTCTAVMLLLGIAPGVIAQRVTRLEALPMRMEMVQGIGDTVLINDTWSCDLDSLRIALDLARRNSRGMPVSLVLSDIPQSGRSTEEIHSEIRALAVASGITQLIGIGPNMCSVGSIPSVEVMTFPDTDHFLAQLNPAIFSGKAVLVKGAREFRFERIIRQLEEKSHDTVLEISLSSLAHNLGYFRSLLKPGTRLMVMVKAFGYGAGAKEIAGLLETSQVDYLAVAYADEGVALRNAGVSLPVMVMNPERSSMHVLLTHRLEPVIYSFRELELFMEACAHHGVSAPVPVHVEFDTGMNRLGFRPEDAAQLARTPGMGSRIRIASVYSHLAASEDPAHDAFTRSQHDRLMDACAQLRGAGVQDFLVHLLNTGGIQRFPEFQLDMVRLGIGLYGIASDPTSQEHLQPVGLLRTVISQLRTIQAGETVGYNRRFRSEESRTIAVIPVGYADGLRRSLGNGVGRVWIDGHFAPVIGSVCMDMTMVDVTGIPCREGDSVEVMGPHVPVTDHARWAGTIPYEVLTSVSPRVRRLYTRD